MIAVFDCDNANAYTSGKQASLAAIATCEVNSKFPFCTISSETLPAGLTGMWRSSLKQPQT